MRTPRLVLALAAWAVLAAQALAASPSAPAARTAYERAVQRERTLVDQAAPPSPRLVRRLVAEYEAIARRYENTGYADNALWHGAELAGALYGRTRSESDRRTAIRLLQQLVATYPTSSLVAEARPRIRELTRRKTATTSPDRQAAARKAPTKDAPKSARAKEANATKPPPTGARVDDEPAIKPDPALAARDLPSPVVPAATVRTRTAATPAVRVTDIRRNVLPEVVRVTIELDGEIGYREERVDHPARLFFDLKGAGASPRFQEGALSFSDDIVRQVRFGARGTNTTRIVMDLDGVQRYSVFSLYNPFRIVIDFERAPTRAPALSARSAPTVAPPLPSTPIPVGVAEPPAAAPPAIDAAVRPKASVPASTRGTRDSAPRSDRPAATTGSATGDATRAPVSGEDLATLSDVAAAPLEAPATPAVNAGGSFSLARQLGLGVSRIVIDPGHGGHDPGARGTKLWEAELVLDVALRLERLLLQQPGVEVVLTRRTDTFVPLEERTAIANRERADLFLSIHANASRNRKARGVETYFLNFASNPQAEAVAARENSASGRTMHNLPDMVRAIALNNKLDESRDLAGMVQRALVRELEAIDPDTKDLGVKQAPFVVLIGAQMPSVLAEISFVTHPEEGALLRTPAYRQGIAEALFDAVLKYQRSLKTVGIVAGQ